MKVKVFDTSLEGRGHAIGSFTLEDLMNNWLHEHKNVDIKSVHMQECLNGQLMVLVMYEDKRSRHLQQGKNELKLYFFSQWEDPYGTYNEFTVLAPSEDDAWKQIKEKMKEPDSYGTDYNGNTSPCYGEYEHDRSVYKVKCYPVDKPVAIRHLSAD